MEVVNKWLYKAVIWNYISLICMAMSGLVMNSMIAMFYGTEALGIFNETYAWYIILSQLSVWGMHMAVVKFVPETDCEVEKGALLWTCLLLAAVISLVITILSEAIVYFLDDLAWQKSMSIAFTAFILFSINKVLLNFLNATYRMVPYGIFTSLRYGCFGALIVAFSVVNVDSEYLAFVFPLTEIIVFITMIIYFILNISVKGQPDRILASKMFFFGTKILPSYMVLEMNTKVDVLCLGFLGEDIAQIGIYSFATLFTEGFYMLYIVVRKIINPSLSEANVKGKIKEHIDEEYKRLKKYLIYGGAISYIVLAVGFYIICMILERPEYQMGMIFVLIISLSIAINGKSIVYGDLLAQVGFPLEESMLNLLTVMVNIIMNLLLITFFKAVGAAIATAISYFVYSFYLKSRIRKRVGVSL